MAVPSVVSSLPAANSIVSKAPTSTGTASLSQSDFMKLLTTQMQFQDPTNPMSSTDMVSQLSQFSSVQGMQQLNTSLTQMLLLQQVTQGANLIGKQITYATSGKSLASTGTVNSVAMANGQVQLMVGTQPISLSQVTSVAAGK